MIMLKENFMKRNIQIGGFLFILFICLFFNANSIHAKQIYYQNKYGVILTEEEYQFLSTMYWDGYQSLMTVDDYNEFRNSKVMEGQIEVKEIKYGSGITPYGTLVSNYDRTLKIFKSCSNDCLISVSLKWDRNPAIRSFDVIGAYIENTSFTNNPTTIVATTDSKTVVTDYKKTNNGLGASFKLPSGSNVTINQTYRVKSGGHVYASYQHAMTNSTLAKSKDYTFSYFGYGRVFQFSDSVRGIYDGMTGVDIAV